MLPYLLDPDLAIECLERETEICELAGSILSQEIAGVPFHSDTDLGVTLNAHLNAVVLANELLWAHESDNPADETLAECARCLKAWHLRRLDVLLDEAPSPLER